MFDRLISLIGNDNLKKISSVKVVLIGVGGVGGFALEALVRSGIKNIAVYDGDIIEKSNLNRQIITNQKNLGKNKVDEALNRALLINPNLSIKAINTYLNEENINDLKDYDYIIDACDDLNAKINMIKFSKKHNIKIICALGVGKRLNPELVKITSLDKTQNDRLAKKLRERLRKEGISLKIPVVYHEGVPLNQNKLISSSIFPPAVAGIYLAYYVINDIISKNS